MENINSRLQEIRNELNDEIKSYFKDGKEVKLKLRVQCSKHVADTSGMAERMTLEDDGSVILHGEKECGLPWSMNLKDVLFVEQLVKLIEYGLED